ncbi:MAG: SRPBCC domain-containing protein [Bacteroidota bacterium]
MEPKTKVTAEPGRQDMHITREFELPLDLLFKAYTEPEIVEQWMGTKVLKLENKKHGSYRFETTDPKGNTYGFNGAIHGFEQDRKITRTFEFENMPFGVQLECLEFESLGNDASRLNMHVIYESAEQRDQVVKFGMTQGINMAHNRLQEIVSKLK